MNQATWQRHNRSARSTHGLLRGFRPPSEETAFLLAFSAVILAVVVLHARGAVKPRPEITPVAIEDVALKPVEVPLVAPVVSSTAPVVPPPPVTAPVADRPAIPSSLLTQPAVAPAMSVHSANLDTLPALRNVASQTGGSFDMAQVTYGELTGAGDVALIPLQSGGSAGTLAIALVGSNREGPQMLTLLTPDKTSRAKMRASFEAGQLVTTTAVLGPEDALCCPSETRRAFYTWDATRLHLERELTTTNPSAKN